MLFNRIFNYYKKVYNSPRILLMHFCFIFSIVYLKVESNHESILFRNIVFAVKSDSSEKPDTVFIRNLMLTINKMMYDRYDVFKGREQLSIKARVFKSVDADLMYGAGACGGFSKVFARALLMAGFKTRIGQMKVNGDYGGHILLETFIESQRKWVVIDPLYLLIFKNPEGNWASFSEVQDNWEYYRKQINVNYNYDYCYEGVRYANWGKIPVLGTVLYDLMALFMGEKFVSSISIRPYLLNHYKVYMWLLFFMYCTYNIIGVYRIKNL